jgi:hypothetical protein
MSARKDWWYFKDERIGFRWDTVCGYHYVAGREGFGNTLYLYTEGGILRIYGEEAAGVYALVEELIISKDKRKAAAS